MTDRPGEGKCGTTGAFAFAGRISERCEEGETVVSSSWATHRKMLCADQVSKIWRPES